MFRDKEFCPDFLGPLQMPFLPPQKSPTHKVPNCFPRRSIYRYLLRLFPEMRADPSGLILQNKHSLPPDKPHRRCSLCQAAPALPLELRPNRVYRDKVSQPSPSHSHRFRCFHRFPSLLAIRTLWFHSRFR